MALGSVSPWGAVTVLNMRKTLILTTTALIFSLFAPVGAKAAIATCPERGVKSVSTGTVVNKKDYATAALCFTGTVDKAGTLFVSGSVHDAGSAATCAVGSISYVVGGKTSSVNIPRNCTEGGISIKDTTIKSVQKVTLSVCMQDQASGKQITCSTNTIYPVAPARPNIGNKR